VSVINYDKPVADFIAGLDATGHVTHRSYRKKSVTLHHNGGRLSLQGILNVWKTRPASAHFQSDRNGDLGQYVRVHEYAWACGNKLGNIESINIEMANETLAPTWRVGEETWRSAARLAGWLFAHVIDGRPRPSRSNLHYHHYWKATECAGPYMDSIYGLVLAEAQRWYDTFSNRSANLTISTKAIAHAYGGKPMNVTDAWFADARQVLAWGTKLAHTPVDPHSLEAWIYRVHNDQYGSAGELYRACIGNLQRYHGFPENLDYVVKLLLEMKRYGYAIYNYEGKQL
jgi:hypothetical protein